MKFFQITLLSLLALCTMAFVAAPNTNSTASNNGAYTSIFSTIQMAHDVDFSHAKVQQLTKIQVIKWMKRNATTRCTKQHQMDLEVIKAILNQDVIRVIRISNIKVKDGKFTELIVAFLPDGKLQQFDFSSYLVTNEACGLIEEFEPCPFIYGYALDLTGGVSPIEEFERCPCMQESRMDGVCGGVCGSPCPQ